MFDYNGRTYKFTGQFAPINQILESLLTANKEKPPDKEISLMNQFFSKRDLDLLIEDVSDPKVLTEKEGKRIALIPGGFKPPHAGHFQLAVNTSQTKKMLMKFMLLYLQKKDLPLLLTCRLSVELYTKDMPNVKIMAGTTPSPVGDVYELIADNAVFKEGDTALLGKSEKDADDARFDEHNPMQRGRTQE